MQTTSASFGAWPFRDDQGTVSMGACLTVAVPVPTVNPIISHLENPLAQESFYCLHVIDVCMSQGSELHPFRGEVLIHSELQMFPKIKLSPGSHSQ